MLDVDGCCMSLIRSSQNAEAASGSEALMDYLGEGGRVIEKHRRSENNAFSYSAAAIAPAEIFIKICCFGLFSKAEQTFLIWGAARNLKCRELKVKSPLKYCYHRKRFSRKDFHKFDLFCILSSIPLSFTRLVPLRHLACY